MKPSNHVDQIREQEQEERAAKKMISTHKKQIKKVKMKPFRVPNDLKNTVFLCSSDKKGNEAVKRYLEQTKKYKV